MIMEILDNGIPLKENESSIQEIKRLKLIRLSLS